MVKQKVYLAYPVVSHRICRWLGEPTQVIQTKLFGVAASKAEFARFAAPFANEVGVARAAQVNDKFSTWRELLADGILDPATPALYATSCTSKRVVVRLTNGAHQIFARSGGFDPALRRHVWVAAPVAP